MRMGLAVKIEAVAIIAEYCYITAPCVIESYLEVGARFES